MYINAEEKYEGKRESVETEKQKPKEMQEKTDGANSYRDDLRAGRKIQVGKVLH